MKTIKELRTEGKISSRAYNAINSRVASELNHKFGYRRYTLGDVLNNREVTNQEVLDITIKDLFEMFDEKVIARWRGIGQKTVSELKSLM